MMKNDQEQSISGKVIATSQLEFNKSQGGDALDQQSKQHYTTYQDLNTSVRDRLQSLRQQGRNKEGKLIKGFIQDATLKTQAASIPSKYETIIYKNQSQKGFGTSQLRFRSKQNDEDGPAPGSYNCNGSDISTIDQSSFATSYSKKGFGNGFVSGSQRNMFNAKYFSPGPGQYIYKDFVQTDLNHNISMSTKGSSMFQCQGRKTNAKSKMAETNSFTLPPGPGDYNPKYDNKNKNNTYYSSFISASKRQVGLDSQTNAWNNTAPGIYNIKRTIIDKKPFKKIGFDANFAKPIQIKKNTNQVNSLLKFLDSEASKGKKLFNEPKPKSEEAAHSLKIRSFTPGPGYYDAETNAFLKSYISANKSQNLFSQENKNRFQNYLDLDIKLKGNPGPADYKQDQANICTTFQDKALVSGSAFMSETTREPFGQFQKKVGPSDKVPFLIPIKKSFHLNLQKNWMK